MNKLKIYFHFQMAKLHYIFFDIACCANDRRAEAFLAKRWKTRKFYIAISNIARFFADAFLKLA